MPNEIDNQMNLMGQASVGVQSMTATHGVTAGQIQAQGSVDAQQAMQVLLERQMRELMQPDANSTIGQAGDASGQKIVIGPARDVIVMPRIDWENPPCYSESWWTRHMAPVPRFEMFHERKVPAPATGLSMRDIKYPPTVPNFPIHFDRLMGYREFLS